MRDRGMVRQALDYSCGAAALATILTYGFDDPVGEREILLEVLTPMSGEQEAAVRKEGLSLLDLQRVAETRGYKARGFRLGPEFLAELDRPVIVFIKPGGYNHFAVLKGIRGDRVFLADPARGNIRMPAYRFLEGWLDETGRGIIFVIEKAGTGEPPRLAFPNGDAGPAQPEVLTARQLLEVGDPYVRFPRLSR